jgi:hypothetical protein
MLDTPTNNFCTWNPISTRDSYIASLSEGNLRYNPNGATMSTANGMTGTVKVSSGKWYFEVGRVNTGNDYHTCISGYTADGTYKTYALYSGTYFYGDTFFSLGWASPGTDGQVSGCAFDLDNNKIWFSKDGVWYNSGNPATNTNGIDIASGLTDVSIYTRHPNAGYDGDDVINTGADSSFAGNKTAQGNQDGNDIGDFYYTPPSGFLALCTKNLPDPTVIPSEHFNTVLYTGTGSADNAITVGFQPDFVWLKSRSNTNSHQVYDAVRGGGKILSSNETGADYTTTTGLDFQSNGFNIKNSWGNHNGSGTTYVAWNWKANGAGVSNTNGSITSTVSADVAGGFSILGYIGAGEPPDTVGHGLSKTPEMIIVKNRDTTNQWYVYNHKLDSTAPEDKYIFLSYTDGVLDANIWNDTAPTSSVFTVYSNSGVTGDGDAMLAYAFHSVDGYSKVGSYLGNGNADGTFVYTGFSPAYVMIKSTASGPSWGVFDSKRVGYNPDNETLYANGTNSESAGPGIDFTSNGFKLRNSSSSWNSSGQTYIFLCFAESPFKHTNAR